MTEVARSRVLAREVVTRVRERDAFAHETMNAVLHSRELEERDAAFATRLALGTVSCRGTLDDAVGLYLEPGRVLEPRVSDALALTAYELLFMRTPSRAAVSQGVELVKGVRPPAARLANAVLRRLACDATSFPWGDDTSDIDIAARRYGHPAWLARLLEDELGGARARAVMAANNEPAPLYLALMPFRVSVAETIDTLVREGCEPCVAQPDGCVVARDAARTVRSSVLSEGHAIVVDAGAQLAAACVPLADHSSVVEIGAGRGGKSLLMAARAARLGIEVDFTAVDTHAFKLDRLAEAVRLVGAPEVRTVVADATDTRSPGMPEMSSADAVLVDAPCSGLGTLRRHPDRRWRASASDLDALSELAGRLLATGASLVRPGGFVVYSTCTITRRENDDVVEAFLRSEAGGRFRVESLSDEIPREWVRFVVPSGYCASVPEIDGPDGHFIARLVRVE